MDGNSLKVCRSKKNTKVIGCHGVPHLENILLMNLERRLGKKDIH
jgi:hypothetical protein